MSYGVKYRCTHKTFTNQTETTYRIDILKDGYSGSITEVLGIGDVFSLEYERIDPTRPLNTPLQNSRLEFNIAVQNDDELAILEEIFENDEQTFKMQLYQDGTLFWDGYVLNDLLEYGQGNYPFEGRIVAKDITALKSISYPLEDERRTAIHQFGVLLDPLNIGAGLKTATSWSHSEMTATNTFLVQSYIDTIAFREFRPLTDEGANDDRQITYYEALEQLARSFGVIVRQSFGEWHIVQLSELRGSTSRICTFDFEGTQVTNAVQNITDSIDKETTYILPQSQNTFNPGLREAQYTFNHRSQEQDIFFPDTVGLADGESNETPRSFSQNISSTSIERNPSTGRGGVTPQLRFRASAEVTYQKILDGTTQQNSAREADVIISRNTFAMVEIKIETVTKTYYLNNNFDWVTNEARVILRGYDDDSPEIRRSLRNGGRNVFVGYASRDWKIDFDIESEPLPTDADGTLSVNLYLSRMDTPTEFGILTTNTQQERFYANADVYATTTRFKNIEFEVDKPAELANTKSINFNIVNSGTNLSATYDHGSVIFGDGPESFSPSAIRYGVGDADFTEGDWTLAGETGGTYANTLLKEILFTQASARRNLTAELYGNYKPHRILSFESYRFFFLGGDLKGNNVWSADFLEIKYESSTPSFKTKTEGGGSTFSGSSSGDLQTFREAVKANQFFNTIFLSNFIGELSSPIEAGSTITSFTANLSAQIRVGEDFVLVDKENERPFFVNVVADPDTGAEEYNTGENRVVHVEEQFIKNALPVGTPVILAGGLLESYFTVDPTKLQIAVTDERRGDGIGTIESTLDSGTYTSIELYEIDQEVQLLDDTTLILVNNAGKTRKVTVSGDQTLSAGSDTLTVDSFTIATGEPDFPKDVSIIKEPSYSSSSRISLTDSSITSVVERVDDNDTAISSITQSVTDINATTVLKTDFNGNIAQFSLESDSGGSSISINADQITVAGQTTFLSALQDNLTFPEGSVVIRSATVPTERPDGSALQDGDVWIETDEGDRPYTYDGTTESFERQFTEIDGGLITTGTIDAERVFAQNITIPSGGSIEGGSTASGFISGSDGFQINADGSAEFNDVIIRSGNFSSTAGYELSDSQIKINEKIIIGNDNTTGLLDFVSQATGEASLRFIPFTTIAQTAHTCNSHFETFRQDRGDGVKRGVDWLQSNVESVSPLTTLRASDSTVNYTFRVDGGELQVRSSTGSSGDIEYDGQLISTSDRLLKENIAELGNTLERIIQLDAKVYDMVGPSTRREIGLFAQDVEPLFPEAVSERTRVNEDEEEITYKTVSYIQLIPALIESIKELKQEIDQLKNG